MADNSELPRLHRRASIYNVGEATYSILKITVKSNNRTHYGSAFLGETEDNQHMLFTTKHIFDSLNDEFTDSQNVKLICKNPARFPVFDIQLSDLNKEMLITSEDPDFAAILMSRDMIKRCENAGSVFVNIRKFVPHNRQITVFGFHEGKQFSFSPGSITEFNEQIFCHNAGSLPGYGGSMVQGVDGNIAGIHIGADDLQDLGLATNINYVVDQILSRFQPYYSSPLITPPNSVVVVEDLIQGVESNAGIKTITICTTIS